MDGWRDTLTQLFLLVALSAAAGFGIMALHGAHLYQRLRRRGAQTLTDCVPQHVIGALVAGVAVSGLLVSQLSEVPLTWLEDALLLAVIGPILLAWLGPPAEHVEASRLCQIGRGSAYSHYYGYLRLMQKENGVRRRLDKWKKEKIQELDAAAGAARSTPGSVSGLTAGGSEVGLDPDWVRRFHSRAVFVLAPEDGEYPDTALDKITDEELESVLPGVGSRLDSVPEFKKNVGGSERSYAKFSIHRVTSSDGMKEQFVALDTVSALGTLRKLSTHKPAGLSKEDFKRQLQDMMTELTKIVEEQGHLRGQIKVVSYQQGEHVGDKIIKMLETSSRELNSSMSGSWTGEGTSMTSAFQTPSITFRN